jgi:hypothetical protein
MNGLELTGSIRAADTAIVVSGKALNKDAKSAGATAFFGNPTNLTK